MISNIQVFVYRKDVHCISLKHYRLKARGKREKHLAQHLLGVCWDVFPHRKNFLFSFPIGKNLVGTSWGTTFLNFLLCDVFDPNQKHPRASVTHFSSQDVEDQFPHPCDVFPMAKRPLQQTEFK